MNVEIGTEDTLFPEKELPLQCHRKSVLKYLKLYRWTICLDLGISRFKYKFYIFFNCYLEL
jgi:hypothetical protein